MKLFKKILIRVVILAAILAVVGLALPAHYHVEESVTIRAESSAIYPYLFQLRKWPEWTAWTTSKYPDMKMKFEGPEAGVGAIYRWDGKSSGEGVLKITQANPTTGIRYELAFDHGKYLSQGSISFELGDDGFDVTWVNEGDLGMNPINRYFGLFMGRMMGPDFLTGLNNLKQKVEGSPR